MANLHPEDFGKLAAPRAIEYAAIIGCVLAPQCGSPQVDVRLLFRMVEAYKLRYAQYVHATCGVMWHTYPDLRFGCRMYLQSCFGL